MYVLKDHTWDFLYAVFFVVDVVIIAELVVRKRSTMRRQFFWAVLMLFNPIVCFGAYMMVGRPIFRREFARYRNEGLGTIDAKIAAGGGSGDLEVARALSMCGALEYSEDSGAEYIGSGNAYFGRLFEDLRSAEKSIAIECYIIRRDATSREFMDILLERARAGVDVYVLFDDYGYDGGTMGYVRGMREAGCRIAFFHNMNRLMFSPKKNCRNHRKTVVIDGRIAYQGGFNIGDEYKGLGPLGDWRDAAVRVAGPQAGQLLRLFEDDWKYTTREDVSGVPSLAPTAGPEGGVPMQVVPGNPVVPDRNPVLYQFVEMIRSARESVLIETPYLVPPEPVLELLRRKARSGVRVEAVFPAEADHPCVYWANRRYADRMMEAGARTFEYNVGFIHTKMVIVDGRLCSVGTANFDERSVRLNLECNVMMYSEDMGGKLVAEYDRDKAECTEYTREMYASRTRGQKLRTFLSMLNYDQL